MLLGGLKRVLDLLPFNGDKLKISGLFLLLTQLNALVPGLSLGDIVSAILANPTRAGVTAVLVSALHKLLKAKYPAVS